MSRTEEKMSVGSAASTEDADALKKGTHGKKSKVPPLGIACTMVLIILVACKLVPWVDVMFVPFASVYVYVMSRVILPPVQSSSGSRMMAGSRMFFYYITGSAIIGLLLPLVLIIISFSLQGDHGPGRDAAPHLFLLCAQVLSEMLTQSKKVSLPIRAMVPIMYNGRRLLTLWTWTVIVSSRDIDIQTFGSRTWVFFERSLAVVNLLFWNYNFWAFLIPVYLPWAFRNHCVDEAKKLSIK